MKGYRWFIVILLSMLAILIIVQLNKPRVLNWDLTLSKDDKNPYGGYILYKQLKDIFPDAAIGSYRMPPYDQVNNSEEQNTAYLLLDRAVNTSKEDVNELLKYVENGNYLFTSAQNFGSLLDSLSVSDTTEYFFRFSDTTVDLSQEKDTTALVNFFNPRLHTATGYHVRKNFSNHFFTRIDTARHIVLGNKDKHYTNFIKIPRGDGAIFLHSDPVCFTNYFLLNKRNYEYTSKALSYIPGEVEVIYWDEFYKLGPEGSDNQLSFLLKNEFLRWAVRIAVLAGLFYVLFEIKRRQRIIPLIQPLRNSTLDFVQTVGGLYFNKRDNKNIAIKKVNHFLEFLRSKFFLQTNHLNEEFIQALKKKTGATEHEVMELVNLIRSVNEAGHVNDDVLLLLNSKIDAFYKIAK